MDEKEFDAFVLRFTERCVREERERLKELEQDAMKATISAASAAKWSARAAWASFAVAVLSLVFQGVPALLDTLRLASKQ